MNSLSKLNNFELEASLKDLVAKERKLLHVILEHIKEVDTRKLYLERAYSSLYEYLVKELNYSGSAAMRRIEAARLMKDVPLIKERIQDGSLNLSQIGELSKAIKEKERSVSGKVSALQKAELVAVISGKTTQETQRNLAQVLDIKIKDHDTRQVQQDESVRHGITFSKELSEKLKRCKELNSFQLHEMNEGHSMAAVIELLADYFLKVESPENKPSVKEEGMAKFQVENLDLKVNKTLTPKTKTEVKNRDKCCQYKDPITGRQCRSPYFPQIDHKTSRWAGGNHSKSNLQVLCANHNRFKYMKESGVQLV